jgi:hypothetical protein
LYRSPNIVRVIKSRRLRWVGHEAGMEEGRSAFKILTGKPTAKRPLGRPRPRYDIRMELVNGHTLLETPFLVRSQKLSHIGRGHYLDG